MTGSCGLCCFYEPPTPSHLTHVATFGGKILLKTSEGGHICSVYIPECSLLLRSSWKAPAGPLSTFFSLPTFFFLLRSAAWKQPKERTGRQNRRRLYLRHERWRVRGARMRKRVNTVKSLLGYVQ